MENSTSVESDAVPLFTTETQYEILLLQIFSCSVLGKVK